jgi:sugar-specific transcriptional regulator TrmB
MTTLHKELQVVGLGKNEALVYEALISHAPCKAGLLITKLDIHRNLIYQSLEKLIHKGFVTKVKVRGVWTFHITDPQALLSAFRRQESVLSTIIEQVNLHRSKSEQQIVIYEGEESYRNYWISSLERVPVGTVDYVLGGSIEVSNWMEIMGSEYKRYDELRTKKKISWKIIQFEMTDKEWDMLETRPELTEYRIINNDTPHVGNVNIIHDTIILQTWMNPPRIIEIRDPLLVTMFKSYFDILWGVAQPLSVSKGKTK